MLAGITPDKANDILKQALAFNGALIISDKAAKALGLDYSPPPRSKQFQPYRLCIAEVDFSPSPGEQQHFVVYDPDNRIFLDPWTGSKEPFSKYEVVSYRLFTNPKPMEKTNYENFSSTIAAKLDYDYGENLNENESVEMVKKIDQIVKGYKDYKALAEKQTEIIQKQNDTIEVQAESIEDLEKKMDKPEYEFKLFGYTFKLYK